MSPAKSTKLKVGITTFLALILLFGGVFWVKEYNPMSKKDTLGIIFIDANGLASGDPVTVSGIKVGEVTSVALNGENKAEVIVSVSKNVRLKSDAR